MVHTIYASYIGYIGRWSIGWRLVVSVWFWVVSHDPERMFESGGWPFIRQSILIIVIIHLLLIIHRLFLIVISISLSWMGRCVIITHCIEIEIAPFIISFIFILFQYISPCNCGNYGLEWIGFDNWWLFGWIQTIALQAVTFPFLKWFLIFINFSIPWHFTCSQCFLHVERSTHACLSLV